MANVRQYKITFKNIKEGEIPCSNPTIKLLGVSDNVVQKCEFTNNSVTFSIYEDAIEGLQGTCINFTILCESCGKCPPKDGKLCFCNDFTDCDPCYDCINGVCVNRCPDMLCVDDKCVSCGDNDDCPGNKICVAGKCQCPPGLPYYDETADKCYGCKTDEECGPCFRCVDGNCVPLNCICDPDVDDCVECTQSSHCGPNEICKNNKCECAPGYVYDPTLDECVPEPPCTSDDDLDPCQICVDGQIQDVICPDPNEVCINGDCVPIPCEGPCDDATDCGPNCGCLNGVCVDCASLDCVTCAQTIGCKCVNGDCEKDNSPCAQYSCDTNCGDRPDCECQPDGSCKEKECAGESTLEKNEDNCQLVYNLETTECCPCTDITVDNKIVSASASGTGSIKLTSLVEVRKGAVTSPLGILNIHRVDESQYDDIMDNEEPTQGQVRVSVKYTYEGLTSGGAPNGIFTTEDVNLTPVADVAGTGFQSISLYILAPGIQNPTGIRILRSAVLTYTLISELTFESGCVYDEGAVIGTYTFTDTMTKTELINDINADTPGQTSNINYWIAKTLTSGACRVPEAKWYKALADSNGNITTFEEVPFRKTYLTKLTPTTYTDFIDEPDENPGPSDNNGELFSGYYYKVATDCACTNEATAYYESTCQNPGRLVFCDPQNASITFDPCGKKFTFNTSFVTDCLPNYDYYGNNADFVPDAAKLRYSIHVNGSETPLSGSTVIADINGLIYNAGQIFTSSELIQYIEIKFSHDNCDECTIRVDSDVDLDTPSYGIVCEPADTGTDVTYTITFTFPGDVIAITVGSNTATSGSPTVTITLANTVTEIEAFVEYDGCPSLVSLLLNLPENCCDDLVVNLTQDSTDCTDTSYSFTATTYPLIAGTYSFSVNGTFAESNSTGLFSTLKNVGGNEPNTITVSFTPTNATCDPVQRTINVDKSFAFAINADKGPNVVHCGNGSEIITYSTIGYTGDVTYSITGAGNTTITLDGLSNLIVTIAGVVGNLKTLDVLASTLVDNTGNGCAIFDPDPINISWVDSPTATSVTFSPSNPCEGETVAVTVLGTSGATATINGINWSSTVPSQVTIGTPFNLIAGTAGNAIINVTNVSAGGCSSPSAVSGTAVVKDSPEITSIVTECETPGNPASNIEITVLATAGSTVTVNPLSDNITLIESPSGTYTGVLDDTFNGVSITVTAIKSGCSDSETHEIDACACDPAATATIRLVTTPITTDEGCEGDTSTYNVITTGLNGGLTYAWRLDSPSNPTVLGTASSYTYTFDDQAHTLYVTVTDSEGCQVTDSIVVTGYALPVVLITPPDTVCLSQANLFTTSVSGSSPTYQWQLDNVNIGGATSATYSYTPADGAAHNLSVIVTTSQGCVTEEIISVTATDCCVECTVQTVEVPGSRVITIIDEDANSYSPPGVYFFVCGDTVQNNATAASLQTWLRAIDPCGALVTVSWADLSPATNCVEITINNSTLVLDSITMAGSPNTVHNFDTSGC